MPAPSAQEMIIGDKLARKLGVNPGDEVLAVKTDINYSTYALAFKVAGLFRSGFSSMDKHMFFIPLEKAQELIDCPGAVHEILLLIKDPSLSVEAASQIQDILRKKGLDKDLHATAWQDHFMVKGYMPIARIFIFSILVIIMAIAGLVILNTMLMTVLERTHEIGIIKSMGMKDKHILWMVLMESFFIGLIGVFSGGLLGSALSLFVQKTGINISMMTEQIDISIPIMSSILYPKFTVAILLISILFALFSAVMAAVYPAWKASRLAPVKALRSSLK